MEIKSRNTNTLMFPVYQALLKHGVQRPSRNGPTLTIPEPVSICLSHPWERVNFSSTRDANPFFHLIESLAMLSNTNSVRILSYFAKNMLSFSDDGKTYNAFYGTRLRETYGDQLSLVISGLKTNLNSRQEVALLWDARDLRRVTKDKACNLALLFTVQNNELCLTSFNRSNDAIWGGVSGANIVHLSFFQEYVALALGLHQGPWWHISNNLHVYTNNPKWEWLSSTVFPNDPYTTDDLDRVALYESRSQFEIEMFVLMGQLDALITRGTLDDIPYKEPFIGNVAIPMIKSWWHYKHGELAHAQFLALSILADDWRKAATQWLQRREQNEPKTS